MKLETKTMIEVNDVSMRFRMANDKIQSLKEYAIAMAKRQLRYKDFWVFKHITFQVKKGEVVGIIGRNGAGKSTLLKIIAGVLAPTDGNVELYGNVVPMLELGSGFDIELSGRENIYLNGSVLGYSEAFIKEKYNEIVEFSGLEEFIEVPIRNYSSGMLMRLAFSIATMVRPEILIVDEILAVGDEAFQRKSKRKMLELMSGGTTVLFVSHSIDQIREMCNRVVWLEQGEVRLEGEPKKVCDAYQEFLNPDKGKQDILKGQNAQEAEKYFMDVLFIYGELGEDYYWRVAHQKEQLLAGNICSSEVFQEEITETLIKKYRMFILVGCEMTKQLKSFLAGAKACNKTVLISKKMGETIETSEYSYYEQTEVLCDRQEQLAEWRLYDREILPYMDLQELSDQELINYHQAKVELEKHKEDDIRIGYFILLEKDDWSKVEEIVFQLMETNSNIILYLNQAISMEKLETKFANRIRSVEITDREEIIRLYSSLDLLIGYISNKKQGRDAWRTWLQAGIVKVPALFVSENTDAILFPELISSEIITSSLSGWVEQINLFIKDSELRRKNGQQAYETIQENYTAITTGISFANYIKDKMGSNQVLFVTDIKMDSEKAYLLQYLLQCKRQGKDVLILNHQEQMEDIQFQDEIFPVISKKVIYIYGSIDTMIADGIETYEMLQSYPNIKHKYYWIQGNSIECYQTGDFSRFRAIQSYHSCIALQYLTSSSLCQQWLKDVFQIESTILPIENILENNIPVQKADKVKILIEGSKYYKDLELDHVFHIVAKLDKSKYEIVYLAAGAIEKDWYYMDQRIETTHLEEVIKLYQECQILLQGVSETRYKTAIQLMNERHGFCVVEGKDYDGLYINRAVMMIESYQIER